MKEFILEVCADSVESVLAGEHRDVCYPAPGI
ncbi:MAG: hypothetical protein K0R05_2027 [Anaerocolumna sp.]|jgi:hypothetical protein|nr:hypothetical protein [Anaerocolumna sp.]